MFIIQQKVIGYPDSEPLVGATVMLTDSSGKPLLINGNIIGRKADVNGNIILPVSDESAFIKATYVGYAPLIRPADDYRNDSIELYPGTSNLKEVIIKAKRIKLNKKKWLPLIIIGSILLVVGITIYILKRRINGRN